MAEFGPDKGTGCRIDVGMQAKIQADRLEIEENEKKLSIYNAEYRDKIIQYLAQGKYDDLAGLFLQREVRHIAHMDEKIARLDIALKIYGEEQAQHIQDGIFCGKSTLEEINTSFLELKFLMWRYLFKDEKDGIKQYIIQNHISNPYLTYMIQSSAFEKGLTAFQMAMLWKEIGRFAQAFGMLDLANRYSPDEEIILCEMADICFRLQQYGLAASYVGRIRNPSNLLASYRQEWGI